jgi:phage-related baseplate assembly protein
MSASITTLPAPSFLTDSDGLDPLAILNHMIATFEQASGKTLYPAQVERLLINLYAYRETLVRNAIQYTGQQNLLAFASYPVLDYIGQLTDTPRLAAQPSTTTLQATLANALTVPYTLPANSQVGTTDGAQVFLTSAALTFPAGTTVLTVAASAQTAGSTANGYLPGQVSVIIGGNSLLAGITNTTTTSDGSDPETDDHYRARIQQSPNKYSSAGPEGAYRFFAASADSTIIDANVITPAPGQIAIYVLTGPVLQQPAAAPNSIAIASPAVLAEVLAACAPTTVRPLCDTVAAYAVTEIDYTVTATVTLFADASSTAQASAQAAAVQLALDLASSISNDLVPSEWSTALSVPGVYEVAPINIVTHTTATGSLIVVAAIMTSLPLSTVLKDASGNLYNLSSGGSSTGSISFQESETATITITAQTNGAAQNLPAGTVLTAVSPVSGVVSYTVGPGGLLGGTTVGSDGRIVLADGEWCNCTAINLTFVTGTKKQYG